MGCLHQDGSGAVPPSRPAGYLRELLEKSFRAPKIQTVQALICREHTDQSHAGKVVAFGEHLCSDQDIHLALTHRLKCFRNFFRRTSNITVDPHHAGLGENPDQRLFDPLGTFTSREKRLRLALRTLLWCWCPAAAVVTDDPAAAPVQRLSGIAAPAYCLPAALGADDDGCKTPAIHEYQALLATGNTVSDGAHHRRRKPVIYCKAIQVKNLDPRHLC